MTPTHFQRLYLGSAGPEYPADEKIVATAIKSMTEHAAGPDPFKVRVRFGDGTVVVVSPKRPRTT